MTRWEAVDGLLSSGVQALKVSRWLLCCDAHVCPQRPPSFFGHPGRVRPLQAFMVHGATIESSGWIGTLHELSPHEMLCPKPVKQKGRENENQGRRIRVCACEWSASSVSPFATYFTGL